LDADWSVEMGHGDEILEFPWTSDDPNVRFFDLKRAPRLSGEVAEAVEHPALRDFLAAVNSSESPYQSAKCDVWQDQSEGNAIGESDGAVTSSSYVDLLFTDRSLQVSFDAHERLVRRVVEAVGGREDASGSAEFIVRRCFYHREDDELEAGCYVTCYVHGWGQTPDAAYQHWGRALTVVGEALLTCGDIDI
jgi:hypothetical protein